MLCLASLDTSAATIAYWRFEPGNLTADSSGSGHDLGINGVTESTDVPANAPGAGSAVFDGSAYAQTLATLDLSTNNQVTLEFFAKSSGTSVDVYCAHDNTCCVWGAWYFSRNEEAGKLKMTMITEPFDYQTRVSPYSADGDWHHYALTMDESTTTPVVKIYVDGIPMDVSGTLGSDQPFPNSVFTIGAFADLKKGFHGLIDEMRVSSGILSTNDFLIGQQNNPIIFLTQAPGSALVQSNSPATFTVGATLVNGDPSQLQYQWQRNGTNIPGANASSYTLPAATAADEGVPFRAIVSAPITGASPRTSYSATVKLWGFVIAYWRFESGNESADSSGNTNDLALTGIGASSDVAANAPGGASASFDGLSSFAQTISGMKLSEYDTLTVEWYSKHTDPNEGMMFNTADGLLYLDINEPTPQAGYGKLRVLKNAVGGYFSDTYSYPTNGTWHHYALRIDNRTNTTFKLYIDGMPVAYVPAHHILATRNSFVESSFILGKYTFGGYFYGGLMDEVRVTAGLIPSYQFLIGPLPTPVIDVVQSPTDLFVNPGSPVSFGVVAELIGTNAVLQYQWQRNGVDIPGANSSSYSLTASESDSGSQFRVVLFGGGVTNITLPATLDVAFSGIKTVAYWRFEPGNLGVDSSGNGNDLTINTITESSDVAVHAPGSGSVYFDGLNSFAETLSPLRLLAYPAITIEWYAKHTTPAPGMLFNGTTIAAGQPYIDINESGPLAGKLKVLHNVPGGSNIEAYDYPADGEWHHYAAVIDNRETNRVIELYIDGMLAAAASGFSVARPSYHFLNDGFMIGKYTGGGFLYEGLLDEVRISSGALPVNQFLLGRALQISMQGGNLLLSWNATGETLILRQASALGGSWGTVANSPVLSNGRWVVTLPVGPDARFFRLEK